MGTTTQNRLLGQRRTLGEQVYEIIHDQILSMELPPGTRLKDSELAESLGISNTPVREALRRLEEAELVETLPRRGTFVRRLKPREAEGLYEVREALETLAVRLAAARASDELLAEISEAAQLHLDAVQRGAVDEFLEYDRRFHRLIAQGADNPILSSMLTSLADRIHIIRRMDLGRWVDEMSGQEHHNVAMALLQRDAERAAGLMAHHIYKHRTRVMELLKDEESNRNEG
jgi:DNA-binding GntR family transcriptional regulator